MVENMGVNKNAQRELMDIERSGVKEVPRRQPTFQWRVKEKEP